MGSKHRMGSTRAVIPVAVSAVVLAATALVIISGGLAATPTGWQYEAIGEAGLPASVLRDAARIRLAVIDTGADLSASGIAARRPATYNVRTGGHDVRDLNGHGTFVTSLAARASGDARLLIVKAGSSSGAFSTAAEATAIRYAVNHGAQIVNLSLGGPQTSPPERAAVGYAAAHGVLIVAPVGNGYGTAAEYPAALLGDAGLAVAASTRSGMHARFLQQGLVGLGRGAGRGRARRPRRRPARLRQWDIVCGTARGRSRCARVGCEPRLARGRRCADPGADGLGRRPAGLPTSASA